MTPRRTIPLHDPAAERALVGAALQWPDRLDGVADDLAAEDFYQPPLGRIWGVVIDLLREGRPVDRVTVLDGMASTGQSIDQSDLIELMSDALPPQREHVDIVLRHSASRKVRSIAAETVQSLGQGDDPYEIAAGSAADLDRVGSHSVHGQIESMTIPELIAMAKDAAPWVVPGLLRRDWRAIVVAGEGLGKSTLLRQVAMCSAQGIHPLTHRPMEPIRTLIVDAENPLAAIAETGATLDGQAQRSAPTVYDPERCRVWSRPGGLDLRTPRDRAELVREIRSQQPRLVVAGPVYKLGPRQEGESYEDAAEGLLAVLDDLRTRFGFALVLEHHAPKPQGGKRDMLPFGSQRWLAWPEVGINLKQDKTGVEIGRFRGDRLRCWWPDRLERGEVWPWSGVWEHGIPTIEDVP